MTRDIFEARQNAYNALQAAVKETGDATEMDYLEAALRSIISQFATIPVEHVAQTIDTKCCESCRVNKQRLEEIIKEQDRLHDLIMKWTSEDG